MAISVALSSVERRRQAKASGSESAAKSQRNLRRYLKQASRSGGWRRCLNHFAKTPATPAGIFRGQRGGVTT